MTHGFQQQQSHYGPILRSAPKPQQIGAQLKPASEDDAKAPRPVEPRTFAGR